MGGLSVSIDVSNNVQYVKIEHVYQPIWDLNKKKIYGYEALVRFSNGFCNGNIEMAFRLAREEEFLYELDTKSISNSIKTFPFSLLEDSLLFINIYPSTLLHKEFPTYIHQLLKQYPYIQGKIVFELSEAIEEEGNWENPELRVRISALKESGFLIAFDDIGKGVASFYKIIELSPDYIKLDRYFAKGLSESKEKQQMILLIIQYIKGKMGLILEGIEEEVDLAQAKKLKVPIAQGYLLGKPNKITHHYDYLNHGGVGKL